MSLLHARSTAARTETRPAGGTGRCLQWRLGPGPVCFSALVAPREPGTGASHDRRRGDELRAGKGFPPPDITASTSRGCAGLPAAGRMSVSDAHRGRARPSRTTPDPSGPAGATGAGAVRQSPRRQDHVRGRTASPLLTSGGHEGPCRAGRLLGSLPPRDSGVSDFAA